MCKEYRIYCRCSVSVIVDFEYCAIGLELEKRGMSSDSHHPPEKYFHKSPRLCPDCRDLAAEGAEAEAQVAPSSSRQHSSIPPQTTKSPSGSGASPGRASPPHSPKLWTNRYNYFTGLGVKDVPTSSQAGQTSLPVPLRPVRARVKGKEKTGSNDIPRSLAQRYENCFPYPAEISAKPTPNSEAPKTTKGRGKGSADPAEISAKPAPKSKVQKTPKGKGNRSPDPASSIVDLDSMLAALKLDGRGNLVDQMNNLASATATKPLEPEPKVPVPIIETVAKLAAQGSEGEWGYHAALSGAGSERGKGGETVVEGNEGGGDDHEGDEGQSGESDGNGEVEPNETEWEQIRPGDVPVSEAVQAGLKEQGLEEWEFVLRLYNEA